VELKLLVLLLDDGCCWTFVDSVWSLCQLIINRIYLCDWLSFLHAIDCTTTSTTTTTTTTTTTIVLRLSGFCQGQPGCARTTHTYHGHQSSLICCIHLLRSMASSLFIPRAWQPFSTNSVQVFFGLPLGLAPSTSYSINFFTQSNLFCNTCPYRRNLFHCSTEIVM